MHDDDSPQEQRPDKFAAEQGEREQARDPHHALNNPATEPSADDWPDPYDRRPDPRAPYAAGEEPPAPRTGDLSTSEPHPRQDPQSPESEPAKHRGEKRPPKRRLT